MSNYRTRITNIVVGALFFLLLVTAQNSLKTANLCYAEDEIWDPIEDTNRSLFDFNNFFDRNLLEPVAKGYKWATPEFARTGIGNFFRNLGYPSYLVSDLVQVKFGQVGLHTGRFLINTTIGIFGLIDVAKHFGLEHHEEDFGVALAYQGVPPGPYIMLPFWGPSNLRDFTGRIVDLVLDPFYWVPYMDVSDSAKFWVPVGATVTRAVHQRANLLDAVDAAKESSLDYYLFVQSAYYQYREGLVNDGKGDE